MRVKELIEKLSKYPQDTKIWLDDNGMGEGACPLVSVNFKEAWDANLDGDEVDDEWEYIDSSQIPLYEHTHKIIHSGDGEFIATKRIIILSAHD